MIAWIILPFMKSAIEALTLFRSAAAFETYPSLNGGNTEGELTQRSNEWVIVVEESRCLRRVRSHGLTCPRTLGWTEAGTIAALQNTPTSSFPLIKLLNPLNDGVSTVGTCAIQLSAFSVMQRYHHWNVFFFPDMFCVISWKEASLKLSSVPPHLVWRNSSSHKPQTQLPLRL